MGEGRRKIGSEKEERRRGVKGGGLREEEEEDKKGVRREGKEAGERWIEV